jgi:hypothetical protein
MAGNARFDPLVLRFGFGAPFGENGVPDRFGVPAGESVCKLRSRLSERLPFFDPRLAGGAASASASAFAR